MEIRAREITALIGPSGCGKSTFLRVFNRMNDSIAGARVSGKVLLDGEDIYARDVDVAELRRRVGMVFQKANPFPKSIFENVVYGPRIHGEKNKANLADIAERSLRHAALWDEVKDKLHNSAFDLSGGQQQRLCIARSLAVDPEVLLMDEPTSALDVSVQAQILNLLDELRRDLKLTYVFISHNLAVVEHVASEVMVMYLGRMVERNQTADLFKTPRHPYTQALLKSVLTPEPGLGLPDVGLGDIMPDPAHLPTGCRFHPRCLKALPQCATQEPPRRKPTDHAVLECHLT